MLSFVSLLSSPIHCFILSTLAGPTLFRFSSFLFLTSNLAVDGPHTMRSLVEFWILLAPGKHDDTLFICQKIAGSYFGGLPICL